MTGAPSSRPAPLRDAVILACDGGYLPYALCLLEGIARLHPERSFDLCLMLPEPAEPPPGFAAAGLRVLVPQAPNPFKGVARSRHGAAAFLRLLIPGAVAGAYRRVLYLDSDMLPLAGGLDRLLAADLHGAVLGAVRDNQQWRTPGRRVEEFRRAGQPSGPYFNSGLLLVDVERSNGEQVLDRALDLARRQPGLLPRQDQSLLNLVLRGGWTELSPVWNWQFTWSTRFFASLAEPRLLHFIGPRKPWADTRGEFPPSVRAAYRDFQRRCYPDRPELVTALAEVPSWPARPVRSFLRHAVAAGAMRRYLDRFPTPWTTRPAGG